MLLFNIMYGFPILSFLIVTSLKFEPFLIELDCNDNWVEDAILNAKKLIETDLMPKGSYKCDTCQYLKKRWDISTSMKS